MLEFQAVLFINKQRASALNLPLFLLGFVTLAGGGLVWLLLLESWSAALATAPIFLLTTAAAAMSTRRIHREGQQVLVRTPFREERFPVDGDGLSVVLSRANSEGRAYSVVAQTEGSRITLAETNTAKGGERAKNDLNALLKLPRATSAAA